LSTGKFRIEKIFIKGNLFPAQDRSQLPDQAILNSKKGHLVYHLTMGIYSRKSINSPSSINVDKFMEYLTGDDK